MKWKDLSLKERKQIYDSVRVNNPDATYLDIKEQFDSIPTYEEGTSSTNLNEQWRKPVGGGMPHWEKANEDAKKLLSGLNKTIGTALTGASLATMGVWNAARLLNIGKGTSWRLAAAENALTGSKAGLVADIGSFMEDPSLTNATQVGLSKVGSKDLTTTSNKIINTVSSGFDFDDLTKVPAYEDGKGKTINKADLPPEYRTGTPVDENMILEYMRNPTSNKMVKNQYDLYRNKNEYIDRLNKLIPMEILMPLGGAGFVGHELNKE